MNFGLDDIINNTVFGIPVDEVEEIKLELIKKIKNDIKNDDEQLLILK